MPPPCGSKAKPPVQTGPAPAGSPRRLVDDRIPHRPKAFTGDVPEPLWAARSRLVCNAERRKREPAIRLLPAKPTIGRESRGEDRGAGVSDVLRPLT